MAKIYIVDVTNRDGVQTSRICLSKLQKTMINIYLDEMGIFQSEFGFPTTNHEINYLNANLELVKNTAIKRLRLSGWLRAITSDIELALSNVPGLKYVNLSISTSDQMIKHKFQGKLNYEEIIKSAVASIKLAKKLGIKAVGINAEDASRSNVEKGQSRQVRSAKQSLKRFLGLCDLFFLEVSDNLQPIVAKSESGRHKLAFSRAAKAKSSQLTNATPHASVVNCTIVPSQYTLIVARMASAILSASTRPTIAMTVNPRSVAR